MLHVLALALFLPLCSAGLLAAQTCSALPVGDRDGAIVSPIAHKVLYEDSDVRVIEVNVAPHSQEQYHTHLRPSVFIMLEDVHYKIYVAPELGGAVKQPPVTPSPRAFDFKPEQAHRVENLDEVRQYAIRVELKHPGCGPATTPYAPSDALASASANYKLAFENNDVRVTEVSIPPHTREPMHEDVLPSFIYADKPAQLRTIGSLELQTKTVIPGRMVRLMPTPIHAEENLSDSPYHAFRIELKHALATE